MDDLIVKAKDLNLRYPWAVPVGGTLALVGAATAAYLWWDMRLEKQAQSEYDLMIQQKKEAAVLVQELGYTSSDEEEEPAPVPYSEWELEDDAEYSLMLDEGALDLDNIFEDTEEVEPDDWDYEHEFETRTDTKPYILHEDEYVAGEMGYSQSSCVYYEADDIMVDESGTPVYGYPAMMGPLKFGHGSGHKDVLFVRNEKLELEWEILRDRGAYEEEVLGLQKS